MFGFRIAGPNEALVVSGGRMEPRIVVGGRTFVVPILQRAYGMSLEVMTLTVKTPNVYTQKGVALSVDGVAQVKVGRAQEAIRTAAQQFLWKDPLEVSSIALQTLEGHQRAILGTMTVEEIYQDRNAFAKLVREVASTDLANMGMEIVSFTIKDISDEKGYLDALGIQRTAEVQRDAAIGKADAARDAGIREADADRERQAARYKADTAIAESERDFKLEKVSYDKQVNTAKADSELAYQLQETKVKQEIREEELQISVVERQKQIEVEEQEVKRRERELEATVRRPAEAERYQVETVAEGNKARIIAEATAEAEATKLRGHAEGDAIRARGLAEAEAMQRKADAWKEYGQAALIQHLLDSLPEVVSAVAQPLAKIERIVVVSNGGRDSDGAGASKITQDIANTIAQVPHLIESLTGIDLLATLKSLPGVKTSKEQISEQPASAKGAAAGQAD